MPGGGIERGGEFNGNAIVEVMDLARIADRVRGVEVQCAPDWMPCDCVESWRDSLRMDAAEGECWRRGEDGERCIGT